VRNFSPSSAPFALARGKITGIITSSSGLITQIKKVGGSCRLRWRGELLDHSMLKHAHTEQ
jgi:hypothetical protein